MGHPTNKRKKEKGFILIVSITILMGLLAVVTTLIRLSSDSTDHQQNYLKTNQAFNALFDTGLGWVEYVFRSRSNAQGAAPAAPNPISGLQRNWWGDGMQSLPFTLYLNEDVDEGNVAGTLEVETLRHVFMSLAVHENSGITLDTTNMYVIRDDELLINDATKVGGGTPSFYGGGQNYGMSTEMQVGYINIGERWLKVGSWYITNALDRLTVFDTDLRNDNKNFSAKIGDPIVYYPFDPSLDIGSNKGSLNITFHDEAGKININSLTETMVDNLFGSADLKSKYLGASDETTDLYVPHRNYQSLAYRSDNINFYDYVDSQKFTVFSKSWLATDQWAFFHRSANLNGQVQGLETGTPTTETWMSTGSSTRQYVIGHPLNVNTANKKTLTTYFETLFGSGNYDAATLAGNIILYRQNLDALNDLGNRVIPNPFDGVNNYNENSLVYFPSPEEELRDFLVNQRNYLSENNISQVMAHAYYEPFELGQLLTRLGSSSLAQPIGFEWDDTWNISITATTGFDDRPTTTRSQNIVGVPVERSQQGQMIINSSSGWNRAYSIFNGVTRKQPVIDVANYDGGDANKDDLIIIDESKMLDDGRFGSFHVNGGMYGKVGSTPIRINSFMRPSQDAATQGNLVYSINRNGLNFSTVLDSTRGIDLGLRVISEDRPTLGSTFGANLTVLGTMPAGSVNITNQGVITPGDPNLWLEKWLVYEKADNDPQYYKVKAIAGTNVTVEPALIDELNTGDKLYMIPEYHPNHLGAGSADVDHPFYETVIHVPGAESFTITWLDSSDAQFTALGGGPAVTARYYTSISATSPLTNGQAITTDNFIRIRFSFDNTSAASTNPAVVQPPQLFGIVVQYNIRADAPPMYIMSRY